MKTYFKIMEFKTGGIITHFRTKCGMIRHVLTWVKATNNSKKVTCKNCKKSLYTHNDIERKQENLYIKN